MINHCCGSLHGQNTAIERERIAPVTVQGFLIESVEDHAAEHVVIVDERLVGFRLFRAASEACSPASRQPASGSFVGQLPVAISLPTRQAARRSSKPDACRTERRDAIRRIRPTSGETSFRPQKRKDLRQDHVLPATNASFPLASV